MIQSVVHAEIALQLEAIAQAYAEGDAPLGELLFAQALDEELPWDEVCAAAARGTARRFGERGRV
jgi:hypothetical protein